MTKAISKAKLFEWLRTNHEAEWTYESGLGEVTEEIITTIESGTFDLSPMDVDVKEFIARNSHQFGYIMGEAARQWYAKDPIGALTVGPCAVFVERDGTYHELQDKLAEIQATIGELDTAHNQMHARNERLEMELSDCRESYGAMESLWFELKQKLTEKETEAQDWKIQYHVSANESEMYRHKLNQALEALERIRNLGSYEAEIADEAIRQIKGEL